MGVNEQGQCHDMKLHLYQINQCVNLFYECCLTILNNIMHCNCLFAHFECSELTLHTSENENTHHR